MEISIIKSNEGLKIEPVGNLDGLTSNDFMQKILPEISEEIKIVIDMEKCHYVSSAGLRALLTIGKTVRMKNGRMFVTNLIDEVHEVMEMTGFTSIFETFEG